MGIVRTLLALSVLFYHSGSVDVLVGGVNAVRLFYAVSGFLISYILVESTRYSRLRDFYSSRYLRLFPIYALVAAISLVAHIALGNAAFFDTYSTAPLGATVALLLSNVVILGQDWILFLGTKGDQYFLARTFADGQTALWVGFLVPQAWSLSLELCFYALAPFVLPYRRRLYLLLVTSIALRIVLYMTDIGTSDPWTYRFFPSEVALFLAGALAHQILRPAYAQWLGSRINRASLIATLVTIGIVVVFPFIPLNAIAKDMLLLALFVASLPLLFAFQGLHTFDARIGELSYPIYVVHVLVIWICVRELQGSAVGSQPMISLIAAVLSIVASAALVRFVSKPIERVRSKLKTSSNEHDATRKVTTTYSSAP
jgi:peptidoglycan/LPS O-acetylase OafA/YrhL